MTSMPLTLSSGAVTVNSVVAVRSAHTVSRKRFAQPAASGGRLCGWELLLGRSRLDRGRRCRRRRALGVRRDLVRAAAHREFLVGDVTLRRRLDHRLDDLVVSFVEVGRKYPLGAVSLLDARGAG